jgi:hypothetical protein
MLAALRLPLGTVMIDCCFLPLIILRCCIQDQDPKESVDRECSIVVIGMRGAGKTQSARTVAAALGWRCFDLDTMLEDKLVRSSCTAAWFQQLNSVNCAGLFN